MEYGKLDDPNATDEEKAIAWAEFTEALQSIADLSYQVSEGLIRAHGVVSRHWLRRQRERLDAYDKT